jgi:prophage antirepressor-like protein
MTDLLQAFTQTIGSRIVTLNVVIIDDTPWFRGNDVAAALGYTNPHQAIISHVDNEDRAKLGELGPLGNRGPLNHNDSLQTFISESGLYSLVLLSRKEEANAIRRWVTKDVMPSIRKTGQYKTPVQTDTVSKKRSELELAEIDERIKACKRRCIENGIMALHNCGLPVDDRDRMRAKDCINSITFEDNALVDADKDICIRAYLSDRGIRNVAMDSKLGREAKRLYIEDHPNYKFPKKTIYVNGQMLQANLWKETQRHYLDRAMDNIL